MIDAAGAVLAPPLCVVVSLLRRRYVAVLGRATPILVSHSIFLANEEATATSFRRRPSRRLRSSLSLPSSSRFFLLKRDECGPRVVRCDSA